MYITIVLIIILAIMYYVRVRHQNDVPGVQRDPKSARASRNIARWNSIGNMWMQMCTALQPTRTLHPVSTRVDPLTNTERRGVAVVTWSQSCK